jgi:predicted nucleic acid-binding protein
VAALVRELGVHVEPVTLAMLEMVPQISSKFRLLTNDSLTLAVMKHLELVSLVTNDADFDTVAGITVWKPQ